MEKHYNKEELKEQVQKVIKYSQGIYNPKIDKLMDDWEKGKQKFIDYMGGNPIYEYPTPVTFPLGEKEKLVKVSDFCTFVEFRYLNVKLSKFIYKYKDSFFDNEVTEDYTLDSGEVIPRGMKLIKAFKYFETDKDVIYDLQNKASQIIQEDKVSGKICVSVHPLDFLSASENVHRWRSCHALDGEYRAGNLSYMVDDNTIMVYIKSEDDYILPNFPTTLLWNSKKWRMWLFLSNDERMMFAGRQYPFKTEKSAEFTKTTLLQAAGLPSGWSDWYDTYVDHINMPNGDRFNTSRKYLMVGNQFKSLTMVIKTGKNALNFNDLLHSSCYTPMYCYRRTGNWFDSQTAGENTKFLIGGPVQCMQCGEASITIPETMRCMKCEEQYGTLDTDDYGFCPICDRHFYYDDGIDVEGDFICPTCAASAVGYCDHCHEPFYVEHLQYDRVHMRTLCPDCMSELNDE